MCRPPAAAREAGPGSLSLYFPICGKGMVTFTLELVLYFSKIKAMKSPALAQGQKDPTGLSAGKAKAQK